MEWQRVEDMGQAENWGTSRKKKGLKNNNYSGSSGFFFKAV